MAASVAAQGLSVIQVRYLSSRHSRIDRPHWLFAADDTREHLLAVAPRIGRALRSSAIRFGCS
jgi:hypothetical protein